MNIIIQIVIVLGNTYICTLQIVYEFIMSFYDALYLYFLRRKLTQSFILVDFPTLIIIFILFVSEVKEAEYKALRDRRLI